MLGCLIRRLRRERPLKIRVPAEQEIVQLLEVFNSARRSAGCFRQGPVNQAEFERMLQGEVIHVAAIGDRIVGFVSVWEVDGFIHHLYVSPGFQGKGVGKALLRMCEGRYGLPLSLKCIRANHKALAFYRSNGWITRSYGSGSDGPWEHLWLETARSS